jgi:hypothetical protein
MKGHISLLVTVVAAWFVLVLASGIPAHAQKVAGPNRPVTVPEGYLITPSGYFHPSCVRRVPSGSTVLADGRIQHVDGTVDAEAPVCHYPHYNARGEIVPPNATGLTISHAWVEYVDVWDSAEYAELTGYWKVPAGPTSDDGQVVYLFTGMMDYNDTVTIIQPVLGWDSDFTNAWSIASWNCCPSGITNESTPVAVSAGDSIYGIIQSTCAAGTAECTSYNITTTDETLGKSTSLNSSSSDGQIFNWAQSGVLEVYSISQCTDYPSAGKITFTDVILYDDNFRRILAPGWRAEDDYSGLTPQCSYSASGNTSSATLTY